MGTFAGYGEKDVIFDKIQEKFVQSLPTQKLIVHQKSTVKKLRDKLRNLLATRKSKNAQNEAASGKAEEVSEADQLLDDFLLEIEEEKEAKKLECEQKTQA